MSVVPCCIVFIVFNVNNLLDAAPLANDFDTLMERVKILEVCGINQSGNVMS